jgi:hypothetical protein
LKNGAATLGRSSNDSEMSRDCMRRRGSEKPKQQNERIEPDNTLQVYSSAHANKLKGHGVLQRAHISTKVIVRLHSLI